MRLRLKNDDGEPNRDVVCGFEHLTSLIQCQPKHQPLTPQETRRHETFTPETNELVSVQRLLGMEERGGGDACVYLYHEGMAALERCVLSLFPPFLRPFGCFVACLMH